MQMEIKYLKESNPWWENEKWFESDFHLQLLENQKIKWNYDLNITFEEGIYSIRGPRQIGKTSWIKQTIKKLSNNKPTKNILFYSCDNLTKENLYELLEIFLEISNNKKKYIFLDEIPFVDEWEKVIKHLYDLGKLKNCFLLVSGSSSLDLGKSSERLPGRGDKNKRHFIMQPLTFKEFLIAKNYNVNKKEIEYMLDIKNLQKLFDIYLLTGGFLKIINEYEEKKHIDDTSYDVYIKWIIGDLAKINFKERYAKQLIRRIIETYTSEISWSSLKSGTDVDTHNTTSKYIESLEEMFILQIIYKMDFSKKIPDYPKSKKIYFMDPFILFTCLKWINSNDNHFEYCKNFLSEKKDKICEGIILNHMINLINNKTKSNVFNYSDLIYYWTNKQKTKEVDFVYKDLAIEVKYQNQIKKSDYFALNEFKKSYLITKKEYSKNTFPIEVFLILIDKKIISKNKKDVVLNNS
jgi:uncharacterized protein